MRTVRRALLGVMISVGCLGAAPVAAQAVPERVIVVLEEGPSDPAAVARDHGRRYGVRSDLVYRSALRGYAAVMPSERLAALRRDARVAFVASDAPLSAAADDCDSLLPSSQCLPNGVDRVDGDLAATVAGNGAGAVNADVAVLDTGIKSGHADLDIRGGANCTRDKRGYDDPAGHGTHVAGTIAARDNAIGVVGVAPGSRLWSVRVLSKNGTGSTSTVVCGIDWVTATRQDASTANDVEVANMSLGGRGADDGNCGRSNKDAIHLAICNSVRAGVAYVVAAGNEQSDSAKHVPAAYDEVITVSALADFDGRPGGLDATHTGCYPATAPVDDGIALFSNYGPDVDLIAPGACVWSTWHGGPGAEYALLDGTSMASPHVAGGAALHLAADPTASPSAVRAALRAAGSSDWNAASDPDGIKEPLLDVTGL